MAIWSTRKKQSHEKNRGAGFGRKNPLGTSIAL